MANKFNVSPRQGQKKKINDTYEYIVVTITMKSLVQNIKTRLAKPNANDPITFCKHLIVSAPLCNTQNSDLSIDSIILFLMLLLAIYHDQNMIHFFHKNHVIHLQQQLNFLILLDSSCRHLDFQNQIGLLQLNLHSG